MEWFRRVKTRLKEWVWREDFKDQGFAESVPEGGGGKGEGPAAPGSTFGLGGGCPQTGGLRGLHGGARWCTSVR